MNNKVLRGAFCAAVISSAVLLSSCGAAGSSAATDAARKKTTLPPGQTSGSTNTTTTTTPTTTTTTTVTTTTSGTEPVMSPNGTHGEFDVPDNFDVQTTLTAAQETVPGDVDPVGAFRFECLAGQVSRDDPIVYPGQPGKSHLHQFFGNTLTNASSNYQSLRTTGGTTCTSGNDPTPQRSAYWMPAMLDGAGNVVKPNRMLTYYKQLPNSLPECNGAPDATHVGFCVPMPNGIRFILGYNMETGTGGPADLNSSDQWQMGFDCWSNTTGAQLTPLQHTIAAVVASGLCPVGSTLRTVVDFPVCWDGVHLDTADHRSHVVPPIGALIDGMRGCTADHPYMIPTITMQAFFTTDANFAAGKWHLASDEMVPGTVAGTTLHADYWEAWSPTVKNMWQTGCINAHLSCNNGELGNASHQAIAGMNSGPFPNHILVPVSSIP